MVTRSDGRPYSVRGGVLTPRFNGSHLQVVLNGRPRFVHHLVLEEFDGPRPTPDHKGLHRDDDPYNNHASNLYWGTMSDNALDRVRNGNDVNARKTQCDRGHPLAGPNLAPWSKKTQRHCLACNRATTLARYYGRSKDEEYVRSLADQKFAEIARNAV